MHVLLFSFSFYLFFYSENLLHDKSVQWFLCRIFRPAWTQKIRHSGCNVRLSLLLTWSLILIRDLSREIIKRARDQYGLLHFDFIKLRFYIEASFRGVQQAARPPINDTLILWTDEKARVWSICECKEKMIYYAGLLPFPQYLAIGYWILFP